MQPEIDLNGACSNPDEPLPPKRILQEFHFALRKGGYRKHLPITAVREDCGCISVITGGIAARLARFDRYKGARNASAIGLPQAALARW